AVKMRGGVSQIRCLHARRYPSIAVEVELQLDSGSWTYRLEFSQDNQRRPLVRHEEVLHNGNRILHRPDTPDEEDQNRLTQTHLEQVSANKEFRQIADFMAQIRYLHVVPQLIREADRATVQVRDPF